jgi:predicted AAA+ superfamily ATPase
LQWFSFRGEGQKEWETEIKLLVDHQPNYRILATGSASVVHKEKLTESGVGRWITVAIPTLSFYEFTHLRGETLPDIRSDLRPADLHDMPQGELVALAERFKPLLPVFQHYLLVGGFPETAQQKDINLCQRLLREDVVERVLKRDMTALFGVRNVNDLEKLFIYLCLHSGSIVAHKTCADALGTSPATVANHLSLLEQALGRKGSKALRWVSSRPRADSASASPIKPAARSRSSCTQ